MPASACAYTQAVACCSLHHTPSSLERLLILGGLLLILAVGATIGAAALWGAPGGGPRRAGPSSGALWQEVGGPPLRGMQQLRPPPLRSPHSREGSFSATLLNSFSRRASAETKVPSWQVNPSPRATTSPRPLNV